MMIGKFYRIFTIDLPATGKNEKIVARGKWTMNIWGQEGANYEAAAIADEPDLDYTLTLDKPVHKINDVIKIMARLSSQGNPVKDAKEVIATVSVPGMDMGTFLSVYEVRGLSYDNTDKTDGNPAEEKLNLLLRNPKYAEKLKPTTYKVVLRNNGDGSYSGEFPYTFTTGIYKVNFQIRGKYGDLGEYNREETRVTYVKFNKANFEKSNVKVKLDSQTYNGEYLTLSLRPRDARNNYLGPDYAREIKVKLSQGKVRGKPVDNLDGSYDIKLFVPDSKKTEIILEVMGNVLYKGTVADINQVIIPF
jgi:hypothetical protein